MFFHHVATLLNSSTVFVGTVLVGGGEAVPEAAADAASAAAETTGGWFGAIGPTTILLYAALFFVLWFFLLRPQRKREKEIRDMQSALKVGDNIVTSGGLFGMITSVGEDCFIIEFGTNKSVRVPVRKTDIMGVKSPNISVPKEQPEKDAPVK